MEMLLPLNCFVSPHPPQLPPVGTAGITRDAEGACPGIALLSQKAARYRRMGTLKAMSRTHKRVSDRQLTSLYTYTAPKQQYLLASTSDRERMYLKSIVFPPTETRDFTKMALLYILSQFGVQALK